MFLVWSHLHTRSGVSFSAVAELEKPSIIINHDWDITPRLHLYTIAASSVIFCAKKSLYVVSIYVCIARKRTLGIF